MKNYNEILSANNIKEITTSYSPDQGQTFIVVEVLSKDGQYESASGYEDEWTLLQRAISNLGDSNV